MASKSFLRFVSDSDASTRRFIVTAIHAAADAAMAEAKVSNWMVNSNFIGVWKGGGRGILT